MESSLFSRSKFVHLYKMCWKICERFLASVAERRVLIDSRCPWVILVYPVLNRAGIILSFARK